MRQDTVAAEHLVGLDRSETNGANPVEELLAQGKLVHVRWCGASVLEADGARIVHMLAETGMRFQPLAVGQVDHAGGDVVDGGAGWIHRCRITTPVSRARRFVWRGVDRCLRERCGAGRRTDHSQPDVLALRRCRPRRAVAIDLGRWQRADRLYRRWRRFVRRRLKALVERGEALAEG